MLHKLLFKIGYLLKRPNVLRYYRQFIKTQYEPYELQKGRQEERLRKLINFAYNNVPYYTKLFKGNNINPKDIKTVENLEKMPILTKQIIKQNWQDFIPKNINKIKYLNGSTGGSTGAPLKYRMSKKDYEIGCALLYRGWGNAGYKLGDKIAMMGGSSLVPNIKSNLKTKIQDFFLNFRHYSSFGMSEKNLLDYFNDINRWRPKFIRGYASSIYLFAKFIDENNLKLKCKIEAIFTTAEKLFKKQRQFIEKALGTSVFDNYGLNDGGISSYECKNHYGMHIDTERAILETINSNDKQIIEQQGKILATSLYNYAMPFIKYDTGDMGIISDSECACGRKTLLLKEIIGRVTDTLKLNNIIIGSPVLTVLMGKFDIEQYQIVQNNKTSIIIKIVQGKTYDKEINEGYIKASFYSHVGKINIKFDYVSSISTTEAKKYKFIINNLKKQTKLA